MAIDNFNKALKLINNKPTERLINGKKEIIYIFPQATINYASKELSARELKLYLQFAGTKDSFTGAMNFYCKNANIKSNHYSAIVESLVKKGFIEHENYDYIKVLYPTEEETSDIPKTVTMQVENNSQKSNPAYQNRNDNSEISNIDSQSYVNNKYINILNKYDKEEVDQYLIEELEYRQKVIEILNKIAIMHSNKSKVLSQLENIYKQKLDYKFIYYALNNKNIEDFSSGIGLLLLESYQNEINAVIENEEYIKNKEINNKNNYESLL